METHIHTDCLYDTKGNLYELLSANEFSAGKSDRYISVLHKTLTAIAVPFSRDYKVLKVLIKLLIMLKRMGKSMGCSWDIVG